MNIYRGDIYLVERSFYNKALNQMQASQTPAVVVSSDLGNESSNQVMVVYLSAENVRPMSVHANVLCRVPSVALCEKIYTVKKETLCEFVRTCSDAEMRDINQALMCSLGIEPAGDSLSNVTNNVSDTVNDNDRVKKLEEQLAAEMARADKERAEKHELQSRIGELIAKMETEAKAADETKHVVNLQNDVMLARAQAERDVYKGLFEKLMQERM